MYKILSDIYVHLIQQFLLTYSNNSFYIPTSILLKFALKCFCVWCFDRNTYSGISFARKRSSAAGGHGCRSPLLCGCEVPSASQLNFSCKTRTGDRGVGLISSACDLSITVAHVANLCTLVLKRNITHAPPGPRKEDKSCNL